MSLLILNFMGFLRKHWIVLLGIIAAMIFLAFGADTIAKFIAVISGLVFAHRVGKSAIPEIAHDSHEIEANKAAAAAAEHAAQSVQSEAAALSDIQKAEKANANAQDITKEKVDKTTPLDEFLKQDSKDESL